MHTARCRSARRQDARFRGKNAEGAAADPVGFETRKEKAFFRPRIVVGRLVISSLAFSADGKWIATGTGGRASDGQLWANG